MDKIAVLIPCYNEGGTIQKVISDYAKALPEAVIYVYDNNSTDKTAELAEKSNEEGQRVIVRKERHQGKGNVLRRMFREIDAQCYLMVDGDDTYDASKAWDMCRMVLEKDADMVIGDRLSSTYFTENKRLFHGVGNKLVRKLINFIFKSEIKDIMTGMRAMSYGFVKTFPVLSEGFEIETEMTIHALDKNMQIENVIIDYQDRPEGSVSKLSTIRDGRKVIFTILRLFKNFKPFIFFGYIALLLVLLGIGLFIPVFRDYLKTGLVQRFPTLIVSGFLCLGGMQTFFCGIMLEVNNLREKQKFEINYIQIAQKRNVL